MHTSTTITPIKVYITEENTRLLAEASYHLSNPPFGYTLEASSTHSAVSVAFPFSLVCDASRLDEDPQAVLHHLRTTLAGIIRRQGGTATVTLGYTGHNGQEVLRMFLANTDQNLQDTVRKADPAYLALEFTEVSPRQLYCPSQGGEKPVFAAQLLRTCPAAMGS